MFLLLFAIRYFIILSMKEYKETQHSIHYKSLSDLSFYSAGYEKCKHSYSYGPKYRNYQLIHFVLSGEGTPRINEQTFNLKQGDAFFNSFRKNFLLQSFSY